MTSLRQIIRRPDVHDERKFERENISSKRARYLDTNPLSRYASDPAYAQKVNRMRMALHGVRGLVLDLGGNTAGEATILAQHGFRFVVGDINEIALQISAERAGVYGLTKPEYVALDVQSLPFRDECFSAVTVIEALHHFPRYDVALREIHRVLRPGGLFFSMEPNASDPLRRLAELRDRFRKTIETSFTRNQLIALCTNAGLTSVAVEYAGAGKSTWKLEEVPLYRRWLARLHGRLSYWSPRWFGSLVIQARKAGNDESTVAAPDVTSLLRSPLNGRPVKYDAGLGVWVEEGGTHAFPDAEGIPVLIADDAVTFEERGVHERTTVEPRP